MNIRSNGKSRLIAPALTLALALAAWTVCAADSPGLLHFGLSGFSIAPLETPPGLESREALMMFLPQNDGFAGNVNVMIQPYLGTIDDYITLTLGELKDSKLTVLQQTKQGSSGFLFEYSGQMQGKDVQGKDLHWYARAEKSGNLVYVVTATASQSDWPKQAAQLRACVNSFRCGP